MTIHELIAFKSKCNLEARLRRIRGSKEDELFDNLYSTLEEFAEIRIQELNKEIHIKHIFFEKEKKNENDS